MKNLTTFLLFLCFVNYLSAQDHAFEILPDSMLLDYDYDIHAFDMADVDNDSDLDIIVSGLPRDYARKPFTMLCLNEGNAAFKMSEAKFTGCKEGAVRFGDIDGDNDPDLFVAGVSNQSINTEYSSSLYLNDGKGNFKKDTRSDFMGVENGVIEIIDIDNDNDQDVLMFGNYTEYPIGAPKGAEGNMGFGLFLNDGKGNFTIDRDVFWGSVGENQEGLRLASADLTGNSKTDILLNNEIDSEPLSEIFINQKEKYFDELYEDENTDVFYREEFGMLSHGSIHTGDVDGDKHIDVLITGTDGIDWHTFVVRNTGKGIALINPEEENEALIKKYSEKYLIKPESANLEGGSSIFVDIDADGDLDIVLSGDDPEEFDQWIYIYINDGKGNFKLSNKQLISHYTGKMMAADINSDKLPDLLLLDGTTKSVYIFINKKL